MATWTSGLDVLDDLDKLSEFSAGCDRVKDIPIVSYSSYGRGSPIGDKAALRPPSPELNMEEEDFELPQSFQPGAGRGERILAVSRNRQDLSLQQQLRMTMGPGYSNELIEDYIRRGWIFAQLCLGPAVLIGEERNKCDPWTTFCPL